MSDLPSLLAGSNALFLDFDGTLAQLAPRPDEVVVSRQLVALLGRLYSQLDGALALVTGRAQEDIDRYLSPLILPAAFEHGAVRRTRRGTTSCDPGADLAPVLAAAQTLAARHPGLLVEHKKTAVALHFRLAPEHEALCTAVMTEAIRYNPDLQLLRGKAVVEVKSAHVDKGKAIAAFMEEAPFKGRRPLFAGDDVTDESGFDVVQRLGGAGIKVGEGASCASHRAAHPQALHQWLCDAAQQIANPTGA